MKRKQYSQEEAQILTNAEQAKHERGLAGGYDFANAMVEAPPMKSVDCGNGVVSVPASK